MEKCQARVLQRSAGGSNCDDTLKQHLLLQSLSPESRAQLQAPLALIRKHSDLRDNKFWLMVSEAGCGEQEGTMLFCKVRGIIKGVGVPAC